MCANGKQSAHTYVLYFPQEQTSDHPYQQDQLQLPAFWRKHTINNGKDYSQMLAFKGHKYQLLIWKNTIQEQKCVIQNPDK